jgi:hypothetical protein
LWNLGLKAGDKVLMRLENLKVKPYLDENGAPRASIEASVEKFLDLRKEKTHRPFEEQFEEPKPGGTQRPPNEQRGQLPTPEASAQEPISKSSEAKKSEEKGGLANPSASEKKPKSP